MKTLFVLLTSIFLSSISNTSYALEDKVFCVWDPVGRNGPVMSFYSDLIPKAQAWGLNIRFVAYTDESVASNDFKAGRCEAVLLTSIMARQYVKFAGTMDAIGAVNTEEQLTKLLKALASPHRGRQMTEGKYEVVASFPVGSMYAYVNDRSINSINGFAGKKMAILNGDPQAKEFAKMAGATGYNVTLATFSGQFNNGNLDIVLMPALAYNTFELYKGLGTKGGIIDHRLYYGLLQTVAKKDLFPEDFGFNMRNYITTRLKAIYKMVSDAEEEIPKHYWIDINESTKSDIDSFSKQVRIKLKDQGINSERALRGLFKLRCLTDPSRGECADPGGKYAY